MMVYYRRVDGDDVFPDYDATPYDGGYDQALVYGEPVPPSHETCYPPESLHDHSSCPEGFTYGGETSPYQREWETVDHTPSTGKGDGDHPLDGGPWNDDCSHPYGYDYGYDCGDNWSYGWEWLKPHEEEENVSRNYLDHAHPMSYLDPLADWLHPHEEDSPYQDHPSGDYRGRQDTGHGCTSEWKSAMEYIFGPQDLFGHSHADGAGPDYSYWVYHRLGDDDRVPTANIYHLQGRSFSSYG